MPRKKRSWIPQKFYHIVCRGNRRDPLFRTREDFQVFLQIITHLHKRFSFEITSYCLMTNHYHLQIRSQAAPISKIMAMLNKGYADYYNTRYRLTGHVFEKRFYDQIIEDKEGMLEVSRYIHLNPVEAKMVKHPGYYPWSSYYFFKYPKGVPPVFMNINGLLDYFTGTEEQRRRTYCQFVEDRENGFLEN